MRWQVQDAKQRFSELIRTAHAEGPQVVTRHGEEIAVVVDIADYRRLKGEITEVLCRTRHKTSYAECPFMRPAGAEWLAGRSDMRCCIGIIFDRSR